MRQEFMDFFKDLNEDNLYDKVGQFISTVNNNYVTSLQTDIMFGLHNRIFPNTKETGKSCSSCRQRVWGRLREWYDKNKKEE